MTQATRSRVTFKTTSNLLLVAGIDFAGDEKDGAFDPLRKDLPLTDEMVQSMVDRHNEGLPVNREPVKAFDRKGQGLVLEDGRTRVRAARAAAEKLGVESVVVEYFRVDEKAPKEQFFAARVANAHRVDDSPLTQAKNCARARKEWGATVGECAKAEGLSEAVMRQRISVFKLIPALFAALESGEFPFSVAIQLSKLPQEKQMETYEKLKAANALNTAAARAAKGTSEPDEGEGDESEGDDSEGETEGAGNEPKARIGLTVPEIRKIIKLWKSDDEHGGLKLDEATITLMRALTGDIKFSKVSGLSAAIKKVRG